MASGQPRTTAALNVAGCENQVMSEVFCPQNSTQNRLVQDSRGSKSTPQSRKDSALDADSDHTVLPFNGVAFKHLAPLHKVR